MAATPSMLQLSRRRAITGTRERRDWQERGATAGVRRVYPGRAPPSTAGKLQPGGGKTTQAVRRRLNAAAETLGVSLKIRLSPTPLTSGHRRVGAAVGPASILTLTTIIPSLVASQEIRVGVNHGQEMAGSRCQVAVQ